MKTGDTVYYARILKNIMYEICELKIRTVEEDYFAGTEKRTKQAFLFPMHALNDIVFYDRKLALDKVKKAEKKRTKFYVEEEEYGE